MDKKLLLTGAIVAIILGGLFYLVYQEYAEKPIEIEKQQEEILSENHKVAQIIVDQIIKKFDDTPFKDKKAMDGLLEYNWNGKDYKYGFVIDMKTGIVLYHPNQSLLGEKIYDLITPLESPEQIKSILETEGKIWVHYDFLNPESLEIEPKTSLFQLHDELIFGSGFYN